MTLRRAAILLVCFGLVTLIAPESPLRLDSRHPHLPGRVGPGEPGYPPASQSPICSGPFPSIFSTATSRPTPRSRRSTRRSGGTAIPGRWASRSTTEAKIDALRAFGLGYLCHLAADTVAHNYFVPRQLLLTSTTSGFGHSYWESRFETPLGDEFARTAKEVILLDHTPADTHLDQILAPTIFSVRTNRRLFRGMVHLTESQGWQRAFQVAQQHSRWELAADDIEAPRLALLRLRDGHAGPARGRVAAAGSLRRRGACARRSGCAARRCSPGRGRTRNGCRDLAQERFGLPERSPDFWPSRSGQDALARRLNPRSWRRSPCSCSLRGLRSARPPWP